MIFNMYHNNGIDANSIHKITIVSSPKYVAFRPILQRAAILGPRILASMNRDFAAHFSTVLYLREY